MKQSLIAIAIVIIAYSCASNKQAATSKKFKPYQISYEGNTKILTGLLKRSDLENDKNFPWFKTNLQFGETDTAAISVFKKNASKFNIVILFGTWCEDSQNLVPAFFRLVDKSGFPEENITLIGVDHKKKTLNNLHTAFNLKSVPTFIVMHDGKEVDRVIEYGKYNAIDKDLAEIVASIK
jgi:thiol-disulfide isomerase/thioredoxin